MFVYYTYKERVTGGVPESSEPYSDRSDAYYDWDLKDLSIERPQDTPYNGRAVVGSFVDDSWVEGDLKARDEAWAIVVRYGSGDTFGSSYGHGTVACVCTDAKSAAKAIEVIKAGGTVDDKGYADWIGYFERLESASSERKVVFT
jgi:hypothetical protein